MRLAVLSDIHGNLHALNAVLHALKPFENFDAVWILGDLAAFGPHPQICIQRVQELQNLWGQDRVKVISGNTDRYLVTGARRATYVTISPDNFHDAAQSTLNRDLSLHWTLMQLSFAEYTYMRDLPSEINLAVPGYGRVIGYHGTPGNDEGWLIPTTPDDEIAAMFAGQTTDRLGLGGHTHQPMDRLWQAWRLINVGSVGAPRAGRGAEYAVLTFAGGEAQVELLTTTFDSEAVRRDFDKVAAPVGEWMMQKMHLNKRAGHG